MLFVLWNERFCTISNVVSLRNLPQIILSLIINHVNISNQPICRYNCSNTQRCRYYANISMNVSAIANVAIMQCYECYVNISMDIFVIVNVAIS